MAAIAAGREALESGSRFRIIALDGAKSLGAKILVAGGGRCNVTHHQVDERAYAGSSRNSTRNVLGRFDVKRTVAFFNEIGVELRQEDTGKLFPTTDRARTVLDALLTEARRVGVELWHPWRVASVQPFDGGFEIQREVPRATDLSSGPCSGAACNDDRPLVAWRVVIATGGKALPKSGSDGQGYSIAKSLGHTMTARIFPALVPLTTPDGHFLRELSGVSVAAEVIVRDAGGKALVSFTNSVLFTHFGLSGPAILDASRYLADARHADPGASLVLNFTPGLPSADLDRAIVSAKGPGIARWLAESLVFRADVPGHTNRGLPERLSRALCEHAKVDPATPIQSLTRVQRTSIVGAVCALVVPTTGDRGFTHAEVTAGGVPLSELRLDSMESRVSPGAHLCGEICDVDGRIGGFNFQWAWSSGHIAGSAAARSLIAGT
ncbi:MAG: aminoacetone oxidase family FAD-binding enzyme [Phycisphaerae bacterium]|nr:aminoacetone oxidase family FAD-binding enzyme [Phycisphaerae bacterium]